MQNLVLQFAKDNEEKINAYYKEKVCNNLPQILRLDSYRVVHFDTSNIQHNDFWNPERMYVGRSMHKTVKKKQVVKFPEMRKFLYGECNDLCTTDIQWRNEQLVEELKLQEKLNYCNVYCYGNSTIGLDGQMLCYVVLSPDGFEVVAMLMDYRPSERSADKIENHPQKFFKSKFRIEFEAVVECSAEDAKESLKKSIINYARTFLREGFTREKFQGMYFGDEDSVIFLRGLEQGPEQPFALDEAVEMAYYAPEVEFKKQIRG